MRRVVSKTGYSRHVTAKTVNGLQIQTKQMRSRKKSRGNLFNLMLIAEIMMNCIAKYIKGQFA